ncbi:MAG: hypothetical protein R3D59_07815 [Paracoccaceae bacterium]
MPPASTSSPSTTGPTAQAADDLVRLKRIVRAQARAHGVTATFMAKPVQDYAGSGMHFHVSLQDALAERSPRCLGRLFETAAARALGGLRRRWGRRCWRRAASNSWRRFTNQRAAARCRRPGGQQPVGGAAGARGGARGAADRAPPRRCRATFTSWRRPRFAGIRHGLTARSTWTGDHRQRLCRRPRGPGDPARLARGDQGGDRFRVSRAALGEEMHRTFTSRRRPLNDA